MGIFINPRIQRIVVAMVFSLRYNKGTSKNSFPAEYRPFWPNFCL